MRMRLRYWSPCFEIGPSFCLPPVEILPRHDPDPGRKITARAKNPRIWDDRCDRSGPNNSNAGDGLEPLTCFVRAMLRNDPLLERSDHRLHSLKLRREYGQAGVGIGRQARIFLLCDDRQQLFDPFAPLCRRNAELGQMRP